MQTLCHWRNGYTGSKSSDEKYNPLTNNAKNARATIILPAISIPVPESKLKPMANIRKIQDITVITSLNTILTFMVF